jgi:Amt family ammonium transporter
VILLDKLKIDDPVGAFPVHGLCGIWGGIATGLFGFGEATSLGVQIIGSLAVPAWAFVTMLGLFLGLRACGLLRVSPEEELAGLDIGEHGMHAYPAPLVVDSFAGTPVAPPAPRPAVSPGLAPQPQPSAETA